MGKSWDYRDSRKSENAEAPGQFWRAIVAALSLLSIPVGLLFAENLPHIAQAVGGFAASRILRSSQHLGSRLLRHKLAACAERRHDMATELIFRLG